MINEKKDNVYGNPLNQIVDFKFDEKVASIFEDMLRRSIPGYAASITAIGLIAKRFHKNGTDCYDLGSSLGAASLSLSNALQNKSGKIFAIDNSPHMIKRSKELLSNKTSGMPVELICADISDVKIKNASVVVLNYTLQFIRPDKRNALLQKIYDGLVENGVLIVSEKIKHENEEEQNLMTDLYYDFKEYNGYSKIEISQKREALENVLIPETLETHIERAKKIGFKHFYQWYKYFTFVSYFVVK